MHSKHIPVRLRQGDAVVCVIFKPYGVSNLNILYMDVLGTHHTLGIGGVGLHIP